MRFSLFHPPLPSLPPLPRVLYVSLHRHDNGGFYPGGDDGNYNKVGEGKGTGYNVNIPWNLVRVIIIIIIIIMIGL